MQPCHAEAIGRCRDRPYKGEFPLEDSLPGDIEDRLNALRSPFRTAEAFGIEEIMRLLDEHPEIVGINRGAQAKYETGIERAVARVEEEDLRQISARRERMAE